MILHFIYSGGTSYLSELGSDTAVCRLGQFNITALLILGKAPPLTIF